MLTFAPHFFVPMGNLRKLTKRVTGHCSDPPPSPTPRPISELFPPYPGAKVTKS
ncbi:MAG: hypothetical protein QOF64_452, partial [Candidatus Binatota bacterium]|nr:hypothetical protein [Candidatus Binatota bacterium]